MRLTSLLFTTVISLGGAQQLGASTMADFGRQQQDSSLYSTSAETVRVSLGDVYGPSGLTEKSHLLYNGQGFSIVFDDGELINIEPYNVKGLPVGISSKVLLDGNYYFNIKPLGSTYSIDVNARLRGGGDRWDGFKSWLVGPHPGWGIFKEKVLPQIAEGTVLVLKAVFKVSKEIKNS